MKVPLIDLKAQYLSLKPEIDEAVSRVLSKGNYVMGEEVEQFEQEWAKFCKARYCVAVSSGTDAIYLTLRALQETKRLYPHNTVWTTPRTFIGTVEPIIRAHMDIGLSDSVPSPVYAEIAVHLYGHPAPLKTPLHQENPHPIAIEDSAQAHGLPLRGFAACHSYYPTKNLGAVGQGGSVVSNDKEFIDVVRKLRSHGEGSTRFKHEYLSGNYRMDELQAAILRVKLPHLREWNEKRREIARVYTELLKTTLFQKTDGTNVVSQLLLAIVTPPEDHPEHVYHIYAVSCKDRDSLASFLNGKGVQTAIRYPIPLHLQPALQGKFTTYGPLGAAEEWANTNLSLPIYPEMTDSMVEYVVECMKEWAQK